jgi:hypothetical protein
VNGSGTRGNGTRWPIMVLGQAGDVADPWDSASGRPSGPVWRDGRLITSRSPPRVRRCMRPSFSVHSVTVSEYIAPPIYIVMEEFDPAELEWDAIMMYRSTVSVIKQAVKNYLR